MNTSQTQFFSELAAGHAGPPIPEAKRVYFQTRLRNRVFNFILKKFLEEQGKGLTKAALARRIGKTPDIVNRWLGGPGNLTIDTISDLMLGIAAEELKLTSESPLNQSPVNYRHADWIKGSDQGNRTQPSRSKSVLSAQLGSVTQGSQVPRPPAGLGLQQ